jgi:hypothetical protein
MVALRAESGGRVASRRARLSRCKRPFPVNSGAPDRRQVDRSKTIRHDLPRGSKTAALGCEFALPTRNKPRHARPRPRFKPRAPAAAGHGHDSPIGVAPAAQPPPGIPASYTPDTADELGSRTWDTAPTARSCRIRPTPDHDHARTAPARREQLHSPSFGSRRPLRQSGGSLASRPSTIDQSPRPHFAQASCIPPLSRQPERKSTGGMLSPR